METVVGAILVYLAFGLPIAILTRIALADNTRQGNLFILFVWPMWPMWSGAAMWATLKHIQTWYEARRCVYCDHVEPGGFKGAEVWAVHARECPKNPLAIENKRMREALESIAHGPVGTWDSQDKRAEGIRLIMKEAERGLGNNEQHSS